jgi:tripartite-type tricarboxylate transporter receptor subunit TctC
VPTIAESGVAGYEMDSWLGIVAPAGTPPQVIERINQEVNRVIAAPAVRAKLADRGLDVAGGTPSDFAKLIRADFERFTRVVKSAGIQSD